MKAKLQIALGLVLWIGALVLDVKWSVALVLAAALSWALLVSLDFPTPVALLLALLLALVLTTEWAMAWDGARALAGALALAMLGGALVGLGIDRYKWDRIPPVYDGNWTLSEK